MKKTETESPATLDYDLPTVYRNLDDVSGPPLVPEGASDGSPDPSPDHSPDLSPDHSQDTTAPPRVAPARASAVSRIVSEMYTISYLVFFSLAGTLARLGVQALTTYPGAPIAVPSIWPNLGGSFVIGFLAEDQALFGLRDGRTRTRDVQEGTRVQPDDSQGHSQDEESPPSDDSRQGTFPSDEQRAAAAAATAKKAIPLYIGLGTGFCGSFTSFSSFIRDLFLVMSDNHSNGGYSLMACVAVVLATVSLSLGGLFAGAHLALALQPAMPPLLSGRFVRSFLNRFAVLAGWGCWVGAVVMCVLPPDRAWRGQVLFALVFAPLGCLSRFYVSLGLNGRLASFPLGTFVVNFAGSGILALCWDVAHAPDRGVLGCQVLQGGLEDGFCGSLTTVSTWVAELAALAAVRRRHAYVYGAASVFSSLALAVAIMGGLRWSKGFAQLVCIH